MKKALITGITGPDGSYLAELLLSKGYEVYDRIRRASSFDTERLEPIYKDPHYYHPAEVNLQIGDAAKAKKRFGWTPQTKFPELVRIMTEADIALLAQELSGKHIRP